MKTLRSSDKTNFHTPTEEFSMDIEGSSLTNYYVPWSLIITYEIGSTFTEQLTVSMSAVQNGDAVLNLRIQQSQPT